MSVDFSINGKAAKANAETDTPLLWVIRDELGLTGTKFGCGAAGWFTDQSWGTCERSVVANRCRNDLGSIGGSHAADHFLAEQVGANHRDDAEHEDPEHSHEAEANDE